MKKIDGKLIPVEVLVVKEVDTADYGRRKVAIFTDTTTGEIFQQFCSVDVPIPIGKCTFIMDKFVDDDSVSHDYLLAVIPS